MAIENVILDNGFLYIDKTLSFDHNRCRFSGLLNLNGTEKPKKIKKKP